MKEKMFAAANWFALVKKIDMEYPMRFSSNILLIDRITLTLKELGINVIITTDAHYRTRADMINRYIMKFDTNEDETIFNLIFE